MQRTLTVLLVLLAFVGTMAFAGGQQEGAEPAQETEQESTPMTRAERGTEYGEAPVLAEQVEAGDLPSVEERLPEEPVVVEVSDSIGRYGGTWNTTLLGGQDNSWFVKTMDYERLFRFAPNSTEIIPNIAAGYEVNDEATEYTINLREGVKWSDGEPFTAEDIEFWHEVRTNEEFAAEFPMRSYYTAGGENAEVTVVDDYTVRFTFAEPNALLIQNLASRNGHGPIRYPKHFLADYTPMYGDEESIQEGLDQYNREDWVDLMDWLVSVAPAGTGSPDLPTLYPWVFTTRYGEGPQMIAERNPYYYKVDAEGNQLPYIDRIVYEQLEDAEVIVLRALNGDIDFQDRHIATADNRATFIDNREQGDYRLVDKRSTGMNMITISLNLTHQDENMREIFQNKDFRIGLSHAINRQEVIDLIYSGQGEPWQAAPLEESPYYDEEMAKQYTEYDVELANEHLDRAGYTERNSDGIRLGPDGNPISFTVEVAAGQQPRVDAMELIVGYWAEVGIDANVRTLDRSLLYTRKDSGQHDVVIWGGDGGLDPISRPRYYFPFSNESNYAPAWAAWYRGDTYPEDIQAMEPPEDVKRQMELYDRITQSPDPEERQDLMNEIIQIAEEQFYAIGVTLPPPSYAIAKNNLRNIIDNSFSFHQYPAHINPTTWYFEE
jgi:peptide/nickel transport system substrate-binding protein